MKAVLIGEDKKLVWTDVADQVATGDQVLLKVHAAAINRADVLQRQGNYPPPPGWPEWMGLEAAGEIVALGEDAKNSGWKIGDKVCALLGGGGYAEYVAVPHGLLMPIPKGLDMAEAAALPEVYAAAYMFLFYDGKLKKGETLLVTAGASGLASVLIPMAKAYGARVITTVLNEKFAKAIAPLGADIVVDTSKESLVEVLKAEEAAGRPVNITIDCLGGEDVGKCLPYMARMARWIMIATLAGDPSTIDLRMMYMKRLTLMGTTLRSRTSEEKSEILAGLVREIWPFIEEGKIRPTIHAVLPIQQAEEAQGIMIRGENVGKIVMTVID